MLSKSHPMWVCGLKLLEHCDISWCYMSHPMWVCGLKQNNLRQEQEQAGVTPYVGVWIETPKQPQDGVQR